VAICLVRAKKALNTAFALCVLGNQYALVVVLRHKDPEKYNLNPRVTNY
jgi:hypothetical protein